VTTTDPRGPEHFNSAHGVKLSHDGLVYVGDRSNRRLQVFTVDGKYVGQVFVNPTAKAFRTASGLAFSPDPQQQFIYVADYENGQVHIVDRKALKQVGSFGKLGENLSVSTGQVERGEFRGLHTIAVDSKGNLWTAETQPKPVGSRVQRLTFKGIS
jgi:DNA-binding beta-propeller fold protein YncE